MPQWLELDKENFRGAIKALPAREDVTLPIREQLIIELYSKADRKRFEQAEQAGARIRNGAFETRTIDRDEATAGTD